MNNREAKIVLGASTMMSKDSAPRNARVGQTAAATGCRFGIRSFSWRQSAVACLLMISVSSSTGCTLFDNIGQSFRYNSVWNDAATKLRHRSLSSKSWHMHKNRHCNEACLDDFCAGFRQGYEDVANGGNGCTPNFPPRDYWGWQHQTAEGQKKVSAWFAGYPNGARAAEEDGVGNWSQIQMSSNLQAQYVRAGVMPNRGVAVYPITEPSKQPATFTGKPSMAESPVQSPMGANMSPAPGQPSAGYVPEQIQFDYSNSQTLVPASTTSLIVPVQPNN